MSEPRPQPAFPTEPAPRTVTWHSRTLLIGVGVVALVGAVLTAVGGQGFPYNAPVEQIYAFGLTVDLIAVAVTAIVLLVVELRRRGDAARRALPVDTSRSVLAILAIVFSGIAVVAWAVGGGLAELIGLIAGSWTRYMSATGALFLTGIPWVLGIIFGVWGFRPGGHRTTNLLALIAVIAGLLLVIPTTIAALVYGAGLSD